VRILIIPRRDPEGLLESPLQMKRACAHGGCKLLERNPLGRKLLFDQARKRTLAETHGNYPAPLRAIEVIRIGIEQGRSAGLEAEARAGAELATSTVCKNLLYLFKLTEEAKKATLAPGGKAREVRDVAVLGAGVMGGAIAQVIAEQAAIPVRLKDIRSEALATGMAHAAERFQKQVERRRLTEVEARRRMALLRPTLVYHGLGACDLMIEAVVESVEVKQAVFAEAAAALPADAVLASNTSSLSVEAIGSKTPHPERVVGMHFFNPAPVLPLVEIVRAPKSSDDAVRAAYDWAEGAGKQPVNCNDTPGFLVNRILIPLLNDCVRVLDEAGVAPEDLDKAMTNGAGWPLGPCALVDLVGIDVHIHASEALYDKLGEDRMAPPERLLQLQREGRLGRKTGHGFFDYE